MIGTPAWQAPTFDEQLIPSRVLSYCKDCHYARCKARLASNPEARAKANQATAEWKRKNKAKDLAYQKKWRENPENRTKANRAAKESHKKRMKVDPVYAEKHHARKAAQKMLGLEPCEVCGATKGIERHP